MVLSHNTTQSTEEYLALSQLVANGSMGNWLLKLSKLSNYLNKVSVFTVPFALIVKVFVSM